MLQKSAFSRNFQQIVYYNFDKKQTPNLMKSILDQSFEASDCFQCGGVRYEHKKFGLVEGVGGHNQTTHWQQNRLLCGRNPSPQTEVPNRPFYQRFDIGHYPSVQRLAVSDLLKIINKELSSDFPKDSRTLLVTRRAPTIPNQISGADGEYYHYGIEGINKVLV